MCGVWCVVHVVWCVVCGRVSIVLCGGVWCVVCVVLFILCGVWCVILSLASQRSRASTTGLVAQSLEYHLFYRALLQKRPIIYRSCLSPQRSRASTTGLVACLNDNIQRTHHTTHHVLSLASTILVPGDVVRRMLVWGGYA